MMTIKPITAAVVACLAFTLLFYKQDIGINLLIAEVFAILLMIACRRLTWNRNHLLFSASVLVTAVGAVVVHSDFVIIMNIAGLFVLVGILVYPEARSLLTTLQISIANIFPSQKTFFKELPENRTLRFRRFLNYTVPIVILLGFIWIYRIASPEFDNGIGKFTTLLSGFFSNVFSNIDIAFVATMLVSLLFANFIFLSNQTYKLAGGDSAAADVLVRNRGAITKAFKINGLANEFKAGIFLLCGLNLALLGLNLTDIFHVWFNFTWDGGYLKQFVHEGTYMLLFSIVLSVAVVLYFFRANLNFFSKSRTLRLLSYAWILQNGVLAFSVGMRNYWYIEHFALAYKRIGLLLFLLLTLYGLYTVYRKVRFKKSTFYLLRMNVFAMYTILTVSSLADWDSLIVRYNLSNAGTAFFEFDYMSRFDDKTLPYLDKPLAFYQEVAKVQKKNLGLEDINMSPEEFHKIIGDRKIEFFREWRSKKWLSWNLPDARAYTSMQGQMPR